MSYKRHLMKTLTWRLLGTTDTICVSWLITGDLLVGISIGFVEIITKMVLYFLHERLWYKSSFGVKKTE